MKKRVCVGSNVSDGENLISLPDKIKKVVDKLTKKSSIDEFIEVAEDILEFASGLSVDVLLRFPPESEIANPLYFAFGFAATHFIDELDDISIFAEIKNKEEQLK